jgi:hypothetical protein
MGAAITGGVIGKSPWLHQYDERPVMKSTAYAAKIVKRRIKR